MSRGLFLAFVGLAFMAGAIVLGLLPDTVSTARAVAASVGIAGVVMAMAGARYRDG